MKNIERPGVFVPSNCKPWPQEIRVAKILASQGHYVEFIKENNYKTADIILDGITFEIKSPLSDKHNSLEHILKKALRQSNNIIIDISRISKDREGSILNSLAMEKQYRKQIKKLIMITKDGRTIEIN